MTVISIFNHAMLEMDEDPADIVDYEGKFRMYLNMGYQLILRNYYKPRETFVCHADEHGCVHLNGYSVEQVVEIKDKNGFPVTFRACSDGCDMYYTNARNQDLSVVCQVNYPALENMLDEPRIPEHVHYALVNYICYKHLSSGNLAKQSRAQYYMQSFYEAMRILKPVGTGSVTKYTNFYSATN